MGIHLYPFKISFFFLFFYFFVFLLGFCNFILLLLHKFYLFSQYCDKIVLSPVFPVTTSGTFLLNRDLLRGTSPVAQW